MPWEREEQEHLLARIVTVPGVLGGKPIIRGMRISVELILSFLALGETMETLLDSYPDLERDDILACLEYAYRAIEGERFYPAIVEPEPVAR